MIKSYDKDAVISTVLRTSTFGVIKLTTDSSGTTELEVSSFSNTAKVSLTPEEFGILLTNFGNACSEGKRLRELEKAEYNLKIENRRKS